MQKPVSHVTLSTAPLVALSVTTPIVLPVSMASRMLMEVATKSLGVLQWMVHSHRRVPSVDVDTNLISSPTPVSTAETERWLAKM